MSNPHPIGTPQWHAFRNEHRAKTRFERRRVEVNYNPVLFDAQGNGALMRSHKAEPLFYTPKKQTETAVVPIAEPSKEAREEHALKVLFGGRMKN